MRLIIFLLIFTSTCLYAQSDRPDYNLLWEISGNNLSEPSYLFGTMHVQDERAFQFSDSVLIAIENTDAFAMEIHPDSIINMVFEMMLNGDTSNILKQLLSDEAYERLDQVIIEKTGNPLDSMDVKDPSWIEMMLSDYDEPEYTVKRKTMVDLYLFDLAYRQGKATYGLEHFKDYAGMTTSFF